MAPAVRMTRRVPGVLLFGELLAEFAPGAPIESRVAYLHRGFIWGGGDGDVCGFEVTHDP